MSKRSEEFFRTMLEFLPSTNGNYEESLEKYGELLETVVIEDIFMPEIITMLEKNEKIELLEQIFKYFEEVSNCNEEHLINIFSTTVLEVLGKERIVLETAKNYMGDKTMQLQIKADRDLGRI